MEFNPLSPEVTANPFPYYTALRDEAPVLWLDPFQAFAVSRYADVDFALRHPEVFSSANFTEEALGDLNPVPDVPWILDMNPPDHTRVRKVANKGFTPRLVREQTAQVREIARALLAGLRRAPDADFVSTFSAPLPMIVIGEMLGVEPERREEFKTWSDHMVRATGRPTEEAERAALRDSLAGFRAYFEDLIERRRREPGPDLISALVRAEEESAKLTSIEILALCVLLLTAGNETTTNLIGNAVLALFAHPDAMERVRADREQVPALVEEVLRYDSPVQIVPRVTAEDVELEGGKIPAGQRVFLLLGSANRDERKYPEPDRFDLDRNARDHLAFGFGTHRCLGAPLARLEAAVGLETLLFEAPRFAPTTDTVEPIASVIVRGPRALPIRFEDG